MARRTSSACTRPHSNKIAIMTRINPALYDEIKMEAAAKNKPVCDVIGEKLSRDSLLSEIRQIVREELDRDQVPK